MLRTYAGSLPPDLAEPEFTDLLAQNGRVHSMNLARDIIPARCRSRRFGFIELGGHKTHAAFSALNGHSLRGNRFVSTKSVPVDGAVLKSAVNG